MDHEIHDEFEEEEELRIIYNDPARTEFLERLPHQFGDHASILDYFFKAMYVDFMARTVTKHTQIMSLIHDLMGFLRKAASDDDVHASAQENFVCKVNELYDHQDFIQAIIDTYFTEEDDCDIIAVTIESYKDDKTPQERLKSIMSDPFLNTILKETDCLPITRGILSILFGYWSDESFGRKIFLCARKVNLERERKRLAALVAKFLRDETVVGIDFPANIEGLKAALRSMYPFVEARFMCEKIDEEKEDFNDKFKNAKEEHRIKGFAIMLVGDSFSMPYISFSGDD